MAGYMASKYLYAEGKKADTRGISDHPLVLI